MHRIGAKALVRIDGEIGVAGATAGELLAAIGGASEVFIILNSIGGDSNAALEIYDGLAGRKVAVEIRGNCFSAGVTIALAGGRIRMRRDAQIMVHPAQLFVFGSADELECGARRLRKVNARLRAIIERRTRQRREVVAGWLSKDSYFTAIEARAAGLVDEIIDAAPAAPAAAAAESHLPGPVPTEDEALVYSLLQAMGPVTVRCKAEFSRAVGAWLSHAVTGVGPEGPAPAYCWAGPGPNR